MAFKGLVTAPGGTLHTVEILGPGTLEAWKESYDVLFTALIMLDVVRRSNLSAYRAKICALAAQYGPKCWALLYQADVRCRSEHMEITRFRLMQKHNAAMTAGTPTTFDTSHPWDSVWAAVVIDNDFWKDEFEVDAILIRTGAAVVTDALGADAPTEGASSWEAKQQHKPQPKAAAAAATKNTPCRNFNFGTCHGPPGQPCPHGLGKHICSVCGSPKHSASGCPRISKGEGVKKGGKGEKGERNWGKYDKKNKRK